MTSVLTRAQRPAALATLPILAAALLASHVLAQGAKPASTPPKKTQKKAAELINKQEPPRIYERVLNQATRENISVAISLGKQRAYFLVAGEVAIDAPISSGKKAGMTPSGSFTIVERDANHRSSYYGNFVSSRTGKVVRSGVSTKIDSAPSGTFYQGAPMKWFMRFGDGTGHRAEGMHTGILPGYPASHGCVRLPDEIAKMFYDRVVIGTSVTIGE